MRAARNGRSPLAARLGLVGAQVAQRFLQRAGDAANFIRAVRRLRAHTTRGPIITVPGEDVAWGELHVGSRSVFADAGFAEVARPTPRRFVMRIDFAAVER